MELLGNNPSIQDLIEKLNEVIGSLNNSLPNTDSEIAEVKKLVSFGSGVLAGRLNAKLWYFKTQELMTASTELCEGDSCFVLKDGATTGEGTFEYWYIYKTSDVVDIIDSYVDLSNPDLVAVKLQDMTLKDVKDTLSAQISDQSKDLNIKISNLRTDTETALSGKADLVDGLIPASQLPSYVDDIIESWLEDIEFPENAYAKEDTEMTTPLTPEFSKIYVNLLNNKTYRWGGNFYVEVSKSLAIGETATTAFSGNRGVQLEEKIEYLENYVTPEMFGAIGDGVTDDSEAFRQAIETGYPIICMTGKDYYFANEIVTSKTRINIDGNYSHFTAFRLKINLNEDETNWKNPYPHPDSVIQNVYFMNKNNMDYCIKTGIPIKFVNISVYSYDLWLKNYGDYMDYMVFDNLAIYSKPSNEHYCIELSYLGDNHVFRECMFVGHNTDINCVQVSGCKAVNFIDCIINGNVIAYESVVNLNGCHFENNGQIICGDKNVNSVINFNGCLFYDHYSVTPGKNVFYNGCGFLVNYITYGGQNDYMALNTRDCIILCGAESANSNSNVIIDELRKNEYPNVVYSGNKVVFAPVVLKHTAKTWGLSAGTYTYKLFQSCNPYSIDYGDPAYSTVEESVTVDAGTSAVRFGIDYDAYPEMFIHAYRTAPDGSIKKVVIPINGQYIYDYGETLNGILWKEVESIPTPKSTTAVYHNGIYYSGKNYTNARNCICVDKANGVIVWIDENGSSTIISGSGSGGLTESQVNNLIDAKLTGVETLLGGGF